MTSRIRRWSIWKEENNNWYREKSKRQGTGRRIFN